MSNQQEIDNENLFRFRPAARHILTIGKGLVKDSLSAIIELVKNSYDADASKVNISVQVTAAEITQGDANNRIKDTIKKYISNPQELLVASISASKSKLDLFNLLRFEGASIDTQQKIFDEVVKIWEQQKVKTVITIEDDGHGMTRDDFKKSWLVPSTSNKLHNPKSKSGKRKVQGQKGIGRYATSVLGEDVCITSSAISKNGLVEETTILLDWLLFSNGKYEFLDEVPILLDTKLLPSTHQTGTIIKIHSFGDLIIQTQTTNDNPQDILAEELSKLYIPKTGADDKFDISVEWSTDGISTGSKVITTHPLEEKYHYRIKGNMIANNSQLNIKYIYINKATREEVTEIKDIPFYGESFGYTEFDFKVFDLDTLQKESKISGYTKSDLKNIVGVAIIRNSFKVRPYGERNQDWLGLNQRRVNSPTNKLSTNQIVGQITIESEDISKLEEKSSRDGLKDTQEFLSLKKAVIIILNQLENKRNAYRNSIRTKRDKSANSYIEDHKSKITIVERRITIALEKANLPAHTIEKLKADLIEFQKPNESLYALLSSYENEIFTYQVQSAIVQSAILISHEAGTPLVLIRSNAALCKIEMEQVANDALPFTKEDLNSALIKLDLILTGADRMATLIETLSEMAIKEHPKPETFNVSALLREVLRTSQHYVKKCDIELDASNLPDNFSYYGVKADFVAIFYNLVNNSIYWLTKSAQQKKYIKISFEQKENEAIFSVEDNAQGILKENEKAIFEPGFTTKHEGTGLGLAIVKDAISRNKGEVSLVSLSNPTIFSISLPLNDK